MPVIVGAGGTYDAEVAGGGSGVSVGTTDTTGRNAGGIFFCEIFYERINWGE